MSPCLRPVVCPWPGQGDQHLFADAPDPVCHLRGTLPACGEVRQEVVYLREILECQFCLQAPGPRPCQLHELHQDDHRQAADRHPVPEQLAPRALEVLREYPVHLKGEPQPESEAHGEALAIVETVVNKDPDAEDEEKRHQYDEVRCDYRTGNRDDDGDKLREKRQPGVHHPGTHADDTRRHPSEVGDRDTARVSRVRHCT